MNVVINSAYGSWYPKGQQRLLNSLRDTGYHGDIRLWNNEVINEHHDPLHPYTMKAAAFVEAQRRGFKNILWMDSSVWAIKNIMPLFDLIEREGMFFWKSGWNLAHTATDKDLQIGGFTRDEAEKLHECASGVVGLNLEKTKNLFDLFVDYNSLGVCSTSRHHDNQSKDPRFKFGRQDQTAFTMAFYKSGFTKMFDPGVYCDYQQDEKTYNESVLLLIRGM
jgi:hypothetical protein